MKIEDKGSEFIPEIYMVKAVVMEDDKTTIQGFLQSIENGVEIVADDIIYKVNPYTICRNTGIKIDDIWLWEYDLLELEHPYDGKMIGFIEFDILDNSWKVRHSLNNTSYSELVEFNKITLIGNVITSHDNFKRMIDYSNEPDKSKKQYEVENGKFFMVEKLEEDYYSIWVIECVPDSLDTDVVEEFIIEHLNEGESSTGTYVEILERLEYLKTEGQEKN